MFPTRLLRSSTVNANEIAHFSRLSAEWWNERGEFTFLHKMNPVRMQFIREKLIETAYDEQPEEAVDAKKVEVLAGLDVLDVGCGGGLLSEVRINLFCLLLLKLIVHRAWLALVLELPE